jgi:hypothetical protein
MAIDNQLVKRAHSTIKWTAALIQELQDCQDAVNGPHYFLENFFYIQHPTRGKIKYKPFDYQRQLIDSYHHHRFNINLLGRQLGKCLTSDTNISVKNKQGIIYDLPIGKFYEYESAKRNRTPLPDISQYQRKEV